MTNQTTTAADERYIAASVHSTSSGTVGRALNNARNHHFVADGSGLAQALTSGELFLSGVSSCGVNLVEGAAVERGIALQHTEATIEGLRERDTPQNFSSVAMHFRLVGPTQAEAEALVAVYQAKCPLYRSLNAAVEIQVTVVAEPATHLVAAD